MAPLSRHQHHARQRLVKELQPDRVVLEACNIAGWVCDLMRGLGVEVQVVNTNDDAWRWRKVKKKNDRQDALKSNQDLLLPHREVYPRRARLP